MASLFLKERVLTYHSIMIRINFILLPEDSEGLLEKILQPRRPGAITLIHL